MPSFDACLGFRLRAIRQMRRISQECLGTALGVTFQQIQKYESGANRICPEKLYKCAQVLGVPVGYFFDQNETALSTIGFDKKIMNIATAVASLPSEEVAKRVYHLILAIKEEGDMYTRRETA